VAFDPGTVWNVCEGFRVAERRCGSRNRGSLFVISLHKTKPGSHQTKRYTEDCAQRQWTMAASACVCDS